jgi:hypothetical protein
LNCNSPGSNGYPVISTKRHTISPVFLPPSTAAARSADARQALKFSPDLGKDRERLLAVSI